MQKLTRSLIALGGLALLAACGDDVSVTAPPPEPPATIASVTVVPATLNLKVGEKAIVTATVQVTQGTGTPATTVTWSSANTTIATVSATGEITGVAAGQTSVRATSTADPTKVGAVAVNVTALNPATISISAITLANGTTVNINNVFGQVDVRVNASPNDQKITKVEVLIDGAVACFQNLASEQAASDSLAAAADLIVCPVNTAEFDPVTGAVKYKNGARAITARAQLQGGTSVATPSFPVVFNNTSGWIVTVSNTGTNTGSPASAISPLNGFNWTQGDHTVKATAVNYAAGNVTVATASLNVFGVTTTLTPATGTQVFSAAFVAGSTWNGTNLRLGNYLSAAGGDAPTILSSTLSDGNTGPTIILNSPANAPNLGLTPLPPIRVDNTKPGVTSANGVVQVAATVGTMPLWVNAAFTFVPTATFTYTTSTFDIGSDNVTRKYWSIAGALPGTANSCDFTGMKAVTKGSDLDSTTVSTVYSTRVQTTDAVGNSSCWDLTGTNGADFVAPTIVTLAGPADQTGYGAVALPAFSFSVTDNASGFGTNPVLASINLLDVTGATTCVFGGTSCAAAAAPLTFRADTAATAGTNGYYTISNFSVSDQALNATSVASRTYLFDNVAPTFSGGISLQPLYTGNSTATFQSAVADNLDLASIAGYLGYPAGTFEYPSQSIGTFGAPLTKTSNVTFSVANFYRCVNSTKANAVTLVVSDFGGNSTTNPAFAIPPANVENCGTNGDAPINTFGATTVTYPTGKTQVDIDGASLATASATSATLATVVDVPINTSVAPFTRVDFYAQLPSGRWYKIGSATGVLAQTPTTRTYTYTFVWDPAAPITSATTTVVGIGVDSDGDALSNGPGAIVLVP